MGKNTPIKFLDSVREDQSPFLLNENGIPHRVRSLPVQLDFQTPNDEVFATPIQSVIEGDDEVSIVSMALIKCDAERPVAVYCNAHAQCRQNLVNIPDSLDRRYAICLAYPGESAGNNLLWHEFDVDSMYTKYNLDQETIKDGTLVLPDNRILMSARHIVGKEIIGNRLVKENFLSVHPATFALYAQKVLDKNNEKRHLTFKFKDLKFGISPNVSKAKIVFQIDFIVYSKMPYARVSLA